MGGTGNHERSPRGEIKGWTAATARRHTLWLWQVAADELSGQGYAMTLTMRDTPATAEDFHRMRAAWLKRVARLGATRVHWVVEWQARGTPHLHAAIYFDLPPGDINTLHGQIAVAWLKVCDAAGIEASWRSQDGKEIAGALGWLKYLAKHASRGANHYQRQGSPAGWEKTGRMWGHSGDWPVVEPVVIDELSNPEFWRVRRMLRNWARNQAAAAGDWKRLRYLRRAGRPDNAHQSRYQGVSEWIPEHVSLRLVDYLEREYS
jgi:hypothetical protein